LKKAKKSKSKKEAKKEIDVLAHSLVPKMEIIKEDAVKRILEKYGITKEQLPKFRHNDPAVKTLEAEPGDVIKIEREDATGKYNVYRVVVPK
jgi:DNA-directed RNA polymerase subunit H